MVFWIAFMLNGAAHFLVVYEQPVVPAQLDAGGLSVIQLDAWPVFGVGDGLDQVTIGADCFPVQLYHLDHLANMQFQVAVIAIFVLVAHRFILRPDQPNGCRHKLHRDEIGNAGAAFIREAPQDLVGAHDLCPPALFVLGQGLGLLEHIKGPGAIGPPEIRRPGCQRTQRTGGRGWVAAISFGQGAQAPRGPHCAIIAKSGVRAFALTPAVFTDDIFQGICGVEGHVI